MYKLVKDFIKGKITFYWIDKKKKPQSPALPSAFHAKEWLINHYFDSYDGPERRKTLVDRRYLEKNKGNSKRNSHTPGRRITDRPIKVDINLADKKIADIIERNK